MVRILNPWRLKGEVTVARLENLRGWMMGNQSECWWNNTILLLGQDLWSGKTFQVWIGRIHLAHGSVQPFGPLCLPHKGQAGPLQVGHLQWQQGIEPHVKNHLWHLCVARWLKVQTLPRSWATFTSTREYETKEIEPFYSEQHQLYVWSLISKVSFCWRRRRGIAIPVKKNPVTLNNKADITRALWFCLATHLTIWLKLSVTFLFPNCRLDIRRENQVK